MTTHQRILILAAVVAQVLCYWAAYDSAITLLYVIKILGE